ncbi:hypothetical protein BJ165DRAFT_1409830 [Panaeolus papilionaceus]|nr:hypothetical protein BJ165DRAFT_1409830 [Panaeolus papilionaceus]
MPNCFYTMVNSFWKRFRCTTSKESKSFSAGLQKSLKESTQYLDYLQSYFRAGLKARKQAYFAGFEESSTLLSETMEGFVLIEEQDFVKNAIKKEKLPANNRYIVITDYNRICAPKDNSHPHSLIFWTKEHEHDKCPTRDKIIGAITYNAQHFLEELSEDNKILDQQLNMLENETSNYFLMRRLETEGKMAKSQGIHSVYSKKYKMQEPKLDLADDENIPSSFRFNFGEIEPLLEARSFAFDKGFLPEFAQKSFQAAKDSSYLNSLGSPRFSTFVTVDYSASGHLDIDRTPSTASLSYKKLCLALS